MNSLGVVNPIGLPAPVARLVRTVPRTAWVFFVAAVAYVLAKVTNTPSADVPSAVWLAVVVGATTGLVIALPGIALLRSSHVRRAAPPAFAGLVLIAVGTILRGLAGGVAGRVVGVTVDAATTGDIVQTVMVAAGWVVVAVGWLALARWFAGQARPAGRRTSIVTAIAVVAVVAIGASIGAALTATLLSVAGGAFDPTFGALVVVGFAAYAATAFSWAALAWVFIRSMASDRSASMVAAGAWAVAVAIGAAFALAPDRFVSLSWLQANSDLWDSIGTVLSMLPPIFLVGAVALGLLSRPAPRHDPEM